MFTIKRNDKSKIVIREVFRRLTKTPFIHLYGVISTSVDLQVLLNEKNESGPDYSRRVLVLRVGTFLLTKVKTGVRKK